MAGVLDETASEIGESIKTVPTIQRAINDRWLEVSHGLNPKTHENWNDFMSILSKAINQYVADPANIDLYKKALREAAEGMRR